MAGGDVVDVVASGVVIGTVSSMVLGVVLDEFDGKRRKLSKVAEISWNWVRNESRSAEKVTGLVVAFVALVDRLDDGNSDETICDVAVLLVVWRVRES